MRDEFDNFDDENEILEGMEQEQNANPAALCFEEYLDCFGDTTDVMKKHLLCTLCGGHLHFSHLADFSNGMIQETARCPDCSIRLRQRLHKLQ